jgi:enoyl-CoA hydratase
MSVHGEAQLGGQYVKVARDGAVATVTIDRQDKLNALSPEVLGELRAAVEGLAALPAGEVRCAVLTGAGKAFVAGADIAAMVSMSPPEAEAFARAGHRVGEVIEAAPFPVLAAVNGFALGGGCELALACDFAYASDKAKFGQPEVKLGVIPGFGGTQRLLRRVGVAMARELVYSGAMIDAQEALRIGLVNRVVPHAELLDAALATARTIATMGPLAVAAAKRVLLAGEMLPLREANALEALAFAQGFATADQKEGMRAFLDKRPAAFTAR